MGQLLWVYTPVTHGRYPDETSDGSTVSSEIKMFTNQSPRICLFDVKRRPTVERHTLLLTPKFHQKGSLWTQTYLILHRYLDSRVLKCKVTEYWSRLYPCRPSSEREDFCLNGRLVITLFIKFFYEIDGFSCLTHVSRTLKRTLSPLSTDWPEGEDKRGTSATSYPSVTRLLRIWSNFGGASKNESETSPTVLGWRRTGGHEEVGVEEISERDRGPSKVRRTHPGTPWREKSTEPWPVSVEGRCVDWTRSRGSPEMNGRRKSASGRDWGDKM